MDCKKTGTLIASLRREKKMTQKQLADAMNISDRTVSKWERGMGCPDVSLLNELAKLLEVDVAKILKGQLDENAADRGNMKRIKFYLCPTCGNVAFNTGAGEISCCGRRLAALKAVEGDRHHPIAVEEVEEEHFVTSSHAMSKEHCITFMAYVACDRVLLVKLYPEQTVEIRFPKFYGGQLYAHCSQHGLWRQPLK